MTATDSDGNEDTDEITIVITSPGNHETGTMTDQDGNVYKTVKIGDQWWMAENLKVTHYRNGDAIPNITDDDELMNLTIGAYCAYDNDESYADIYGYLYNGFAVADNRNIAPPGWHVPTFKEIFTLGDYLGGDNVAGGKLKETGTTHWSTPNTGATNESCFSALPAGYCSYGFHNLGNIADFLSATEMDYDSDYVAHYSLLYYISEVRYSNSHKRGGSSVRLIRD